MVVIEQILRAGIGMDSFHMAFFNPKIIMQHLEHWGNSIGGTRGGTNDFIFLAIEVQIALVDAIYHIFDAFGGSGKEYAIYARTKVAA